MGKRKVIVSAGGAALAAFALHRVWGRLMAQERAGWRRSLRAFAPRPLQGAIAQARLTRLSRGESYRAMGRRFLELFRELADLRPTDRVLEVGSGFGRIAHGLTGYLRGGGSLDGFDVLAGEVKWCRRHITRRHPHFRFQVADLHNEFYNPTATQRASEFRFPYADGAFDFVYLISVFTHLLPVDVDHYLGEIARVLAPGGRCFITYYLLSPDAYARGAADQFPHQADGYRAHDRDTAEMAVAYEEEAVRALYTRHGLTLREPIRYGTWCGRDTRYTLQDVVVADKP